MRCFIGIFPFREWRLPRKLPRIQSYWAYPNLGFQVPVVPSISIIAWIHQENTCGAG
jgi:hypothetical protein